MPQDLTGDESTLVQVMAWCCQAWANVDPDLCGHIVSLGPDELMSCLMVNFNNEPNILAGWYSTRLLTHGTGI